MYYERLHDRRRQFKKFKRYLADIERGHRFRGRHWRDSADVPWWWLLTNESETKVYEATTAMVPLQVGMDRGYI